MSYLIARRGKVIKITNVAEVKATFTEWIFVKEDGTMDIYTKYTTDFLGKI